MMSRPIFQLRTHLLLPALLSAALVAPCQAQPEAALGASSAQESYGPATYTVPSGWRRIQHPTNLNAAMYQSPVYDGGEICRISLYPPIQNTANVVDDARRTFAVLFGVDPLANSGPPFPYTTLTRGVSPEGWSYFVIQHSINGRFGEYGRLYGTRTLAVTAGEQSLIIVASGKDPQVSQCFGELVRDAWPAFFASLHFNTRPTVQQTLAFRSSLVGTWQVATASAGGEYTFTTQSRYRSTAAFMARSRINPTEVLETTSAYFGDGRFSLQGNRLVLTPDRGGATSAVIRVEQESQDSGGRQLGANWIDRLCLMEGGNGEVCYRRTR
jgi:hypothetical protein